MKFSMKEKDGRYNLSKGDVLGDWIVKPPSTKHKDVSVNEYTAMKLAELVGVEIPEIKLVELNKLGNLPQINLPDEKLAFAIKRFDRKIAIDQMSLLTSFLNASSDDSSKIVVCSPFGPLV